MSVKLPPAIAGSISADELLTLDAVKTRLGLGTRALRTARRNGLKVRRIGQRSFVLGRDLLSYVEKHGRLVD